MPHPDSQEEPDEPTPHDYHCVIDGEQLVEIGLGLLLCTKCRTQFIPTTSADEKEFSLTWLAEK